MGISYRVGSDLYYWLIVESSMSCSKSGHDANGRKFAPMVRDIALKRVASVLSSGCGDLTRTQMKVESTDGMKETY